MKRLFILFVAAVAFGWAVSASADIAYTTRHASHGNGGAGATSVTTITGQVSGNTNIVVVEWCNNSGCTSSTAGQTFTVTDGAGNSYSSADKRINTSASQDLAIAVVHASSIATSASNTLTLTITGGTPFYALITVSEWSGISNSSPQDQTGSVDTVNGTASPLSITAAGATAQAAELVFAFGHTGDSNPTLSAGAGYAIINQPDGQDADEYQIVSSIATYTATFTYTGTASQMGVLVTYKAAPVAPTITSANNATFTMLINGTFTATATGLPPPTFSETGSLPSGVTLTAGGVLSGIPGAGTAGSYPIVITATNGTVPDATQNFTLTIIVASYLTGQLISAPLLPQVTPSAAYPPDTGYTLTAVASGANLQTAISIAACGTKLNLQHNGSFANGGTAYTLPNNSCTCHTDATKFIIIQSDAFEANYTPGVRTDPSVQYLNYAHIASSDANYAFTANANGASCWGFAGLDIYPSITGTNALVAINSAQTQSVANFSHDFSLWGVYIHGQPTFSLVRGIINNGNFMSFVDSYCSEVHVVAQDNQCIVGWDGLGGELIQNSFLEAATENYMSGGADPANAGVIRADLTFQRNHAFKPLSWRGVDPSYIGISWSVKNIFELKFVSRMLITGNVFDRSWVEGQVGNLITMNEANSGTTNPSAVIQDINFYYNEIRHGVETYQIGGNVNQYFQPVHRFNIHDNLSWDIDSCKWGGCSSGSFPDIAMNSAVPAGALYAPYDVSFDHETFASANQSYGANFGSFVGNYVGLYGLRVTNSVLDQAAAGTFGSSQGAGDTIMPTYTPGGKANNNCMYGTQHGTYGNAIFSGVQQINSGQSGVFVTPGSDFHVKASSSCYQAASDGKSMGADIDALTTATAGVVQTLGNLHTVTNVSPSTFTRLGGTGITITGTNFVAESGLGVIIGGAGPAVTTTSNSCSPSDSRQFTVTGVTDTTHFAYTGGCNVVMSSPITLAVNDTIAVTPTTINRYTPGNLCTSLSVVNSTTITCVTPAATGVVTNGPVSLFVSQFGLPIQSTVFATYN